MNYHNAYRQTSVNTSSPGRLLIMLFDGLLRFLNEGIAGIKEENIEKAHGALCRAQDIVLELRSTLDHAHAPELCSTLHDLYSYFYSKLVEANTSKQSTDAIEEIIGFVREIRDSFYNAEQQMGVERER